MELQANEATFLSYLLFWTGELVSLLGSSVAQFVIIWWITLETGSALVLSIATLLGFAPMVVLGPIAGVLIDRWNRKALIGIVDFLQALVTTALIFLFWSGTITMWQILALLTLRGVFQAFHSPAVMAVVPTMVPKDKLSRMNGVNYLFTGLVTLIGPVVAALLLEVWAISQILWIDVTTFLVALIPLLIIKIPSVRRKHEETSFRSEFMEGFAFINNSGGLLSLLILATALNFLITPLSTLLSYYVKFDHIGEASDLAFVMASMQGGMLAGGILMSVIKGFKKKMFTIVSFMYVLFLGYALVALTPTGLFWFMATGGLIMLFCVPIVNVSFMTVIQTVVPMKMQGRVNSLSTTLASAAQPLGMILSGPIAGFTGTANLFLGCAGFGILLLTLSWFFTDIRHVEEMEETSTEDLMMRP
jgi:DHA3 family macrolide efflux protein-like MFS transporter